MTYDMGVNFIIRGDDHLNNVFRQNYIYKNMNWPIPKYAHITFNSWRSMGKNYLKDMVL